MFRPSPTLGARLRLTTKQVNGGYYKGNRTGSMGGHTRYGGYVVDYRKVRHYNCPELTDFKLTPFVTQQMEPTQREQVAADGTTFTPDITNGMEYLRQWKWDNPDEYEHVLRHQAESSEALEAPKETKIRKKPKKTKNVEGRRSGKKEDKTKAAAKKPSKKAQAYA